MDIKNVKNALYLQIDNKIIKALSRFGVEVLPSLEAWEKYEWSRKYFSGKPKEGYFVWVKKQVNFPVSTCMLLKKPTTQNLQNLLVIEKNIKAKAIVFCGSNSIKGTHIAQGKVVLKEGSSLEYAHTHSWKRGNKVFANYSFILEENSKLFYNYKAVNSPKVLEFKTQLFQKKKTSSELNIKLKASNTEAKIEDLVFLEGKDSSSNVLLRLVGSKNSRISAKSTLKAFERVKGHLDCQGLLIDSQSKISLIPELSVENKEAQLTHEASIGRIAEEQLNYLRSRGLSKKEAIELIVSGFLR